MRMRLSFGVVVLFVVGLTLGACGDAADGVKSDNRPKPGINDRFKGEMNVDEWVQRFESESREVFQHRDVVIEALDLEPGTDVADIGAGTGFYSLAFAQRVRPKGRVYAVDIAKPFLARIEDQAEERGLDNVRTVLCPDKSTSLRTNSIDVAFICDTYHHFEYPAETLASLYKAMRRGGRVHIIEFVRHDADGGEDDAKWMALPPERRTWIADHVRCDRETVIAECRKAGFEVAERQADEVNRVLHENYMLTLVKPK